MTKILLATSLFATCFATTALTPSYSFAKDAEIYFYPKHKWVVEQVGAPVGDSLKTCGLSNKFNNGYVVQIAGNANGFTNMNINFHKDIFEPDTEYKVNYSVPGVYESSIPTKAYKKSLIVSDLRGNDDFINSLRNASVLDVQVTDNNFRMYMTGLSSAMLKYDDCIAPPEVVNLENPQAAIVENIVNIEPIQINEIDVAPPPPQIEIVIENESEGSAAAQDMAAMPEHKLRPSPSSRPRYTERLAQQLKDDSAKYKPEIIENIEQTDNMIEPEASVIKTDVSEVEKQSSTKILEEKVTDAFIIIDADTPSLQQENNAVPIEESFEVASVSAAVMDDAAGMLANIEPIAGTSDDDFTNMRDKVSELEGRIEVLLSKNKMLDEELKTILQDAEDERLSVSSNNWNLERATMKFNEAERQIMRLGRKLQTYKAQCQQEKTELENMLFDPELTNKNQLANLALLEEEIESVKSDLYRQQRQYEERIRLLEQQLEAQ